MAVVEPAPRRRRILHPRPRPPHAPLAGACSLLLAAALLGIHLLRSSAAATRRAELQAAAAAAASSAAAAASEWAEVVPPDLQLTAHEPAWAAACAAKACHYMQMKSGTVNWDYPFSSQFKEDEWLARNLFFEKRNGFYLEVGAVDGVSASKTLWLHKAANWTGMLVEADPQLAAQLFEQRPESLGVNAAVCLAFQRVHWKGGGSAGGIVEYMSEEHRRQHHPDLGDVSKLPEVPCMPLQFLLDRWGIAKIELMTLDVGGAELEVLRSLHFERLRIRVVLIETDGTSPAKDGEVADLLAVAGFAPVRKVAPAAGGQPSEMSRRSTVFVAKDAWPLLARAPDITEVVMH